MKLDFPDELASRTRGDNLAQVWEEASCSPRTELARRELSAVYKTPHRHADLERLLRHHDEGTVTGDEVELRDSFDFLLAACGEVEIGFIAGVLPSGDEVHDAISASLRVWLNVPAVRTYYETNYVLGLPTLLRWRLEGRGIGAEAGGSALMRQQAFATQWALSQAVDRDDDVETLLWLLDGGQLSGLDIERVLAAFGSHERFAAELTGTRARSDAFRSVVDGLSRYLPWCTSYAALLDGVQAMPLLQSALWHQEAYWFRRMQADVIPTLRAWLRCAERWNEHASVQKVEERAAVELEPIATESLLALRRLKRPSALPDERDPIHAHLKARDRAMPPWQPRSIRGFTRRAPATRSGWPPLDEARDDDDDLRIAASLDVEPTFDPA